jgi:2-amino-4-hydroxy-6-hydroxymethyldihydropteridine diphosphokinase
MILIGVGGNLETQEWGEPRQTLAAALAALGEAGIAVVARSGWYRSEPVPHSDQPWFVNAVAALDTGLEAAALLAAMQAVERRFGRTRGARDAARTCDLDLLDYEGERLQTPSLVLPHPRLHLRRFVLLPLAELAPLWRHPILDASAAELLSRLDDDYRVERIDER